MIRAEKGSGNACSIVRRVSQVFEAELVVPYLPKHIPVALRNEVIGLINPAVGGQGRECASRRVRLSSSNLPNFTLSQELPNTVVEAAHDRLKVKTAGVVGRRQHVERDVLF